MATSRKFIRSCRPGQYKRTPLILIQTQERGVTEIISTNLMNPCRKRYYYPASNFIPCSVDSAEFPYTVLKTHSEIGVFL